MNHLTEFFINVFFGSVKKNFRLTGQIGDGREQAVLDYVRKNVSVGDTQGVLKAMDDFAWKQKFLVNIGDVKGKILDEKISEYKPKVVLELGTYLGYSAIRMASSFESDEYRLYSIEKFQVNVDIAKQIVDIAGMSNRIEIIQGTLETAIPLLKNSGVEYVDFVFIDHFSENYHPDLMLLLQSNLLKKNKTVLFADNALGSGAQDYVRFVTENTELFQTEKILTKLEYNNFLKDAIAFSLYLGSESNDNEPVAS